VDSHPAPASLPFSNQWNKVLPNAADDSTPSLQNTVCLQPQALARTARGSGSGSLATSDRDRPSRTHPHESSARNRAQGNQQNEIGFLLRTLLPQGQVVAECPLSTSDGVKAIDVAWLAPERRQEVRSVSCLVRAPEICVEVLSPSNTPRRDVREDRSLL
jgi:hypothetical protein